MKCTLCGYEFSPEEAGKGCVACAFAGNCRLLRCPNCGFEAVPDPAWIDKLRNLLNRRRDAAPAPPGERT